MIVSVNFLFVRIAPFVLIASVIGVVLTYKEVKMEAEQEKKINEDIHQCKGQITCNIGRIIDEIRNDDGK